MATAVPTPNVLPCSTAAIALLGVTTLRRSLRHSARESAKSPLIVIGGFSSYDDPHDPTAFETRDVLYHYGPQRLVIGKNCALGTGTRFLMNGANHRMDGPSTFPTMGGSWTEHFALITDLSGRGDTVVGNDVRFGHGVTVMPGVRIGHGAIIAAGAVVAAGLPDHGIVVGNPARLTRTRYDAADIARLLAVAWWDWPVRQLGRATYGRSCRGPSRPGRRRGTARPALTAPPRHSPARIPRKTTSDRADAVDVEVGRIAVVGGAQLRERLDGVVEGEGSPPRCHRRASCCPRRATWRCTAPVPRRRCG